MTPHFMAHIIHILESIEALNSAVQKGKDYCMDAMVYQGILRILHTLSESACKLPDDIKETHPDIRWPELRDFRNILVHNYLGDISEEEIFDFIQKDLPTLQKAMLHHIPNWEEIRDKRTS